MKFRPRRLRETQNTLHECFSRCRPNIFYYTAVVIGRITGVARPSDRPSGSLSVTYSKTKSRTKTKICVNVHYGMTNRRVNSQFKSTKGQGHLTPITSREWRTCGANGQQLVFCLVVLLIMLCEVACCTLFEQIKEEEEEDEEMFTYAASASAGISRHNRRSAVNGYRTLVCSGHYTEGRIHA